MILKSVAGTALRNEAAEHAIARRLPQPAYRLLCGWPRLPSRLMSLAAGRSRPRFAIIRALPPHSSKAQASSQASPCKEVRSAYLSGTLTGSVTGAGARPRTRCSPSGAVTTSSLYEPRAPPASSPIKLAYRFRSHHPAWNAAPACARASRESKPSSNTRAQVLRRKSQQAYLPDARR